GAGAVERGGLENRCIPCGVPWVRIPPSPPVPPPGSCPRGRSHAAAPLPRGPHGGSTREHSVEAHNLNVVDHPLVQHKLSILRDERTNVRDFRALCAEISMLMAYDAMRD